MNTYIVSWKCNSLPIKNIKARVIDTKSSDTVVTSCGVNSECAIVNASSEAEAILLAHQYRKALEV